MSQPAQAQSTESLSQDDILDFGYGVGSESYLIILCYSKRFYITVSGENLQGDPRATDIYLALLWKFDSDEPVEETIDVSEGEYYGDPMEELCFWIGLVCNTVMRELASKSQPQRFINPDDWFYPETWPLYQKESIEDCMIASQKSLKDIIPKVQLSPSITSIPIIQPQQSPPPLFGPSG